MALYRVHFVDHGGNIYSTHEIEHDADEDAIETAHAGMCRSSGPGLTSGKVSALSTDTGTEGRGRSVRT
jgi:hypothetical protein